MSEWRCVECAGGGITSIQPAASPASDMATGICPRCSTFTKDKDGRPRQAHRVGLTRRAFTPTPPKPKRAAERKPERLW